MSQDQKEKIEQQQSDDAVREADVTAETKPVQNEATPTPKRKVKRRVVKQVNEADLEAISPRASYWPLALAFAIVVFLYGAIGNPIIMGIGVVLIIAAVMGWALERR